MAHRSRICPARPRPTAFKPDDRKLALMAEETDCSLGALYRRVQPERRMIEVRGRGQGSSSLELQLTLENENLLVIRVPLQLSRGPDRPLETFRP